MTKIAVPIHSTGCLRGWETRLLIAFLAWPFAACRQSEDATRDPRAPSASSAPALPPQSPVTSPRSPNRPAPEAAPAWGGLSVHESGVPLSRARRALLLLHGYGADAEDLRQVAELLLDQEETAIVLPQAPRALPQGGFAWFEMTGTGFEQAVAQLRQFLTYFQEQHPRLPYVLGGFSQGAILSANLLSSTGPTLRAVLLFSGANIVPYPPPQALDPLPVFISHGRDDRVLSFEQGRQLAHSFERLNYKVTWAPFSGGHSIPREVLLSSKAFLGNVFDVNGAR